MPQPPPKFIDEHIASRKDWGRYVGLTTRVHRRTAAQADEFLAQLRARIEQAMRHRS